MIQKKKKKTVPYIVFPITTKKKGLVQISSHVFEKQVQAILARTVLWVRVRSNYLWPYDPASHLVW